MKELTTQMYTQHVRFKHHITLYEWAKTQERRGENKNTCYEKRERREGAVEGGYT